MFNYILKRLLLIIPTLLGIIAINFAIVQAAPGGPVEQMIAKAQGLGSDATARISGAAGAESGQNLNNAFQETQTASSSNSTYRGAQGLPPEFIAEMERQFGFDKPPLERFMLMIGNYLRFDFGKSYYRDVSVIDLVIEKLPVSISLGLWSTLIIYLISIPLGIKRHKDGEPFDIWSSGVIFIGYAIPSFLFAILLIILFTGGRYLDLFPLRGLTSDGFEDMNVIQQIVDYVWHMVLPIAAMVVSGFAGLTMLTKNSFWMKSESNMFKPHGPRDWRKSKFFTAMCFVMRC